MALDALQAAVNTAAIAYLTAIRDMFASTASPYSAGDQVIWVAPDNSGDGNVNKSFRFSDATASNVTASGSVKQITKTVADSEYPFRIGNPHGGSQLIPLVWFITNEDGDLS